MTVQTSGCKQVFFLFIIIIIIILLALLFESELTQNIHDKLLLGS